MTATATVTVAGVEDLKQDLQDLLDEITEGAGHALADVADRAGAIAGLTVPYDSGALAASIESGQRGDEGYIEMGGGEVGYAGWVEYGGSRGRDYIPTGRFLIPVALHETEGAALAVSAETESRIRGMRWSNRA